MIATLVGGFVSILVGVSLIGPISAQVTTITTSLNSTGSTCTTFGTASAQTNCQLWLTSPWGATVLNLVPGFFALAILGVGLAVTYSSLQQAGIL
ncbi:hypothetical protein M0R04_08880 [Candidatus Dojkabacteria bacterium]|jgi:hypothetical protein|nr:hypothetical protein [Candidatus Dojkabacteria bacterium]